MKIPELRVSLNLVAAWRFMRRLFAFVAVLSLVGCEEPEKEPPVEPSRILAIEPESMRCREWNPDLGRFVGEYLPAYECIGKPTPEVMED
jgi:hypothetical protein